jgi:hypothetical protein
MADDKIVTKKTAAKPAATAKKAPVGAPGPIKTLAKKVVPSPAASVTQQPPMTKAAAAAAAAARPAVAAPAPAAPAPVSAPPAPVATPAAAKPLAKKAAPRRVQSGEPPLADPEVHPAPLEEKPVSLHGLANVTPEQRLAMIREAAYYRAEKRGFAAGNDAQDWADAEREIDELLTKAQQIYGA